MKDDIYRRAEPECLAAYADRVGLKLECCSERGRYRYLRHFKRGVASASVAGDADSLRDAVTSARPHIERMLLEGWE